MKNELYSHSLKLQLSAQIDTLCDLIKSENRQHRTDLNDTLEDILCKVINIQKGLNLGNLNDGTKQEAGLDLGDEAAKTCYQITAESTSAKIHDCLDKYEDKKWFEKYDTLIILFANDYTTKLENLKLKDYSFDPIAVTELMNKHTFKAAIERECDVHKLAEIVEYLEIELSPLIDNPDKSIPVISEIVAQCMSSMNTEQLGVKTTQELPLHIKEKIVLNFEDAAEADQVSRYIKNAMVYSSTINEVVNNFPDLDPADLEEYMMDVYNRLESQNKNPMQILMEMFDYFIPKAHAGDLKYMSWSRRFVLKYFENCSIFKRSKREIEQGVLL